MGEDELLAYAEERAETIREAEADLLRIAYQWAIIHHPDRLDPAEADRPGRERARQLGGDGTPRGLRVRGRRSWASGSDAPPTPRPQLMADALDLHHRLPRLWARVEAGEVRASYARHVCNEDPRPHQGQAAYVDAAVAESADGRIPWSRFETLVEAKVAAAAPEAAREKEEQAAKATFAKKLRTEAHGMATFMVRADLRHHRRRSTPPSPPRPTTLRGPMPDADVDSRRVHAVLLMAHPGATPETPVADLLPTVQLYLHSYARSRRRHRIARLEGHGPVTEAWITRVLGTQRQVQDPPGPRPGRPGTRGRLRDPGPT